MQVYSLWGWNSLYIGKEIFSLNRFFGMVGLKLTGWEVLCFPSLHFWFAHILSVYVASLFLIYFSVYPLKKKKGKYLATAAKGFSR